MKRFTPEQVQRMYADKTVGVASRKAAKRIAKAASARYGLTYAPYRCPICNHYHLTTRKDGER